MKFNMAYSRFHHFCKDKVTMDFAFFAIAFNIKKLCSKMAKQCLNEENTPNFGIYIQICPILSLENQIFLKNHENSAA